MHMLSLNKDATRFLNRYNNIRYINTHLIETMKCSEEDYVYQHQLSLNDLTAKMKKL